MTENMTENNKNSDEKTTIDLNPLQTPKIDCPLSITTHRECSCETITTPNPVFSLSPTSTIINNNNNATESETDKNCMIHSVTIDRSKITNYSIPNPNERILEQAMKLVDAQLNGKILALDNIVNVTRVVLTIVCKLKRDSKRLSLEEIKSIAINIMQRQIDKMPLNSENTIFLNNVIIPLMLPGMIDSLTGNVSNIVPGPCCCCL